MNRSINNQQGAVLLMSLILLAVMMIIGVSGAQMIANNEVITGNFVDRSYAFQSAEAALKAGQDEVFTLDGRVAEEVGVVINCLDSENTCSSVPPSDGYQGVSWRTVGSVTNSQMRADLESQYYLERVAEIDEAGTDGVSKDAKANEYNIDGSAPVKYAIYRVTARSNNPDANAADGRSHVVLQSLIKRPF